MEILKRLLSVWLVLGASGMAQAKPKHFEHVRTALIARAARCNTCHTDPAGTALNAYGEQLMGLGEGLELGERINRLAKIPVPQQPSDQAPVFSEKVDADRDGVLDWVEILAGASPGDEKDKPDRERVERITAVVSCRICHQQVGIPGKRGLEGNPHNELGALLLKTFVVPRGEPRPRNKDDRMTAALRTPILARLKKVKRKKPKGSQASYWEQLRTLHVPTDPEDVPELAELEAFRARAKAQRKKSTRDPEMGVVCEAHPLAGLLLDAKGLD